MKAIRVDMKKCKECPFSREKGKDKTVEKDEDKLTWCDLGETDIVDAKTKKPDWCPLGCVLESVEE